MTDRLLTVCNLKQCVLAVHAYHDNYKRFPHAYSESSLRNDKNVSLWIELLPFVEQDPLYAKHIKFQNERDLRAIVPPYLAASDPFNDDPAGRLNFAANLRIFAAKTLLENHQPVNEPGKALEIPAGPLKSGMTFRDFPDGTATTIMMSTRYSRCGGKATWYAAGVHGETDFGEFPSPGVGGFMGAGSATTPAAHTGPLTAMYQLAPRQTECLPDAGIFGHSFGPGGMSVALADGSVRNISPTMSPTTFARALCPANGQKLGDDWADD